MFRAPTISELYGGVVDSFPTYTDPCVVDVPTPPGCNNPPYVQGDSQVRSAIGGNPDLIPETGDTYTLGVVWSPEFGDHAFTATVDYWSIDLDDGISSLGVSYTLDACYYDLNPQACALITRDQFGQITLIRDTQLNVASQGANGVDTELRWNYSSSWGQWEAAILWAHLLERTKVAFPGDVEQELQGRYTDPTAQDGGAYAEDKVNYSLQWLWNDLSIGYLGEYISSLTSDTVFFGTDYTHTVDSQLYHDLVASYSFGNWGVTLSGGVTNLTDEAPPFIDVGFNAKTDPPTYRMFGRGYYLRASWKF